MDENLENIEENEENNEEQEPKGVNRKAFLKTAAYVAGGLAVTAGAVKLVNLITKPETELPPRVIPEGDPVNLDGFPNVIHRMQDDLKRALLKPEHERNWVMVIDLRKCTGCNACTISCIAENHLPAGVVYRPVLESEIGKYPNVSIRSTPRPCMQCQDPPCVPVCPVKATWKRKDGVIDMDYNQCIGCRYCMTACPYHARIFDFGYNYTDGLPGGKQPYEKIPNFEYNQRWEQGTGNSPVGNVRKCHFCTHKLQAGMLPSCVSSCIGYATYFGDANDSKSLVAQLVSFPNKIRLKQEMGTNPNVYYLI